jgi:hypothetical protein
MPSKQKLTLSFLQSNIPQASVFDLTNTGWSKNVSTLNFFGTPKEN